MSSARRKYTRAGADYNAYNGGPLNGEMTGRVYIHCYEMLIRHPLSVQRVHLFLLVQPRFSLLLSVSFPLDEFATSWSRRAALLSSRVFDPLRLASPLHQATLLYFIVMQRGRFYYARVSRFQLAVSSFTAARAILYLLARSSRRNRIKKGKHQTQTTNRNEQCLIGERNSFGERFKPSYLYRENLAARKARSLFRVKRHSRTRLSFPI